MTGAKQKIDRSNLRSHLGLLTGRWLQLPGSQFQAAVWRPQLHRHIFRDGVRQKKLAASSSIEGPFLVRLLATLFSKKLIQRSEDDRDRRGKLLRLTPHGTSRGCC